MTRGLAGVPCLLDYISTEMEESSTCAVRTTKTERTNYYGMIHTIGENDILDGFGASLLESCQIDRGSKDDVMISTTDTSMLTSLTSWLRVLGHIG